MKFHFQVPFLRFLLGTPSSVNLRNIVSHGFPRVYEIDISFAELTLLIILNLGMSLKMADFQLKTRAYALDSVEKMNLIQINSDWMESKVVTFFKVICSSRTLLDYHKMFWTRALHFFLDGKFGASLLLLLPQLEMLLRLLYGAANDLDVSAQFNRYYVIMDTLLEDETADGGKPNALKQTMDESSLALMYDLFIAPKGPRLRDRISHGELPLHEITKSVTQAVFLFSFHVISQFDSIIELPTLITGYNSVYHPVAEFYRKIVALTDKINTLYEINLPEELSPGVLLGGRENKIPPAIGKYKEVELTPENCTKFIRGVLKYDREQVNLLIRVLDSAWEAVENFCVAIKTRSQEFLDHTLSTARRQTFESMVKHFEEITLGLTVLLAICKKAGLLRTFLDANGRNGLIKDYKKVLKWAENLKQYLNLQNNDWKSACETTKLLLEYFEQNK